jgi:hypothetical protein
MGVQNGNRTAFLWIVWLEKVTQFKKLFILFKLKNWSGDQKPNVCFWFNVLDFIEDRPESIGKHEFDKLVIANLVFVKSPQLLVYFIADIGPFFCQNFHIGLKELRHENIIKLFKAF